MNKRYQALETKHLLTLLLFRYLVEHTLSGNRNRSTKLAENALEVINGQYLVIQTAITEYNNNIPLFLKVSYLSQKQILNSKKVSDEKSHKKNLLFVFWVHKATIDSLRPLPGKGSACSGAFNTECNKETLISLAGIVSTLYCIVLL